MEHIPAMHAAKVGMRYPARVVGSGSGALALELDLSGLAPGREPKLKAILVVHKTVAPERLGLVPESLEVVLIEVDRQFGYLTASLPAPESWLDWNNGTVRQLARRIRETGETVLIPVLADALEEAGCTDGAVLKHLRQHPPDERSWAVTLLATQE